MAGREPPFRYWPANVKKRPSQREALSCLYNLCTFFFLRFLRLFAAISTSVLPLRLCVRFSLSLVAVTPLCDLCEIVVKIEVGG